MSIQLFIYLSFCGMVLEQVSRAELLGARSQSKGKKVWRLMGGGGGGEGGEAVGVGVM